MRPVVLIVDDVPDLLQIMEEAIAMAMPDHDVRTAASGFEAKQALEAIEAAGERLELVLADQSLGDRQGLHVLSDALPTGARLVLVTGRATAAIEAEAQRLGATVLWKPFRLQALLTMLTEERTEPPHESV